MGKEDGSWQESFTKPYFYLPRNKNASLPSSRLPPILSPKLTSSPASTPFVSPTLHLYSQLIIHITVAEARETKPFTTWQKFSVPLSALGAFGGIAFRDACNISITRHTGVPPSLSSPPNRLRSDGPTRASSSIEIPAARPTPKKEFPRRGAGHPRRVHRAQNSGGTKDVYLVSPPLAWVSRRDTPTARGMEEGVEGQWDIRYREHGSRAACAE